MKVDRFIGVGENIHCTRIYKVGGLFVKEVDGVYGIAYESGGEKRRLAVPDVFTKGDAWQNGKVKHCAVAIWMGNNGDEAGRAAGTDYIKSLAMRQESAGALYLDINVDEYSTDVEERMQVMEWTVKTAQEAVSIPMSIDSSNVEILRAGLQACDQSNGRPMVNSVSLERLDAVKIADEYNAVVIASAAGEQGLPQSVEERIANVERLIPKLEAAEFAPADIHLDPLVFPISVDGKNGTNFLDTVSALRAKYGAEIHIVAGLSNVSFGMPSRKLINQVFAYLAVEAGADGGIVDPMQINGEILSSMDVEAEDFKLARALLLGEDEFGMNFITTMRERKG